MSQRWEAVAATYDAEKPRIVESAPNAPSIKAQAQQGSSSSDGYPNGDGSSPRHGASARY